MSCPRKTRIIAARLAALILLSSPSFAQSPIGSEFLVNTYTTWTQMRPSVAADPHGSFVVTWMDDRGIPYAQGFLADGRRAGPAFRVERGNRLPASEPSVVNNGAGTFLLLWDGMGVDESVSSAHARRFKASGEPIGPELQIGDDPAAFQATPVAAFKPDGSFVLVGTGLDGDSAGIFAQRYNAAGGRVGAEFRVNSQTAGRQIRPVVASDASGNFLVVWSLPDDGPLLLGQVFDPTGNRRGAEFLVGSGLGVFPSVARNPSGFVVVWDDYGQSVGRLFDTQGQALGSEFRVGGRGIPRVASDAAGNFSVVWGGFTTYWRRFDPEGHPLTNEEYLAGQAWHDIAMRPDGSFVLAFDQYFWDDREFDIKGRRYGAPDGAQALLFGRRNYSVIEGGSVRIDLQRTGDLTLALSVDYQTSNGTARGGLDYRMTSGTLFFPPGATSASLYVSAFGDTVIEDLKSFTVTFDSTSSGAAFWPASVLPVTIRDDDGTDIHFESGRYAVPEGGGPATVVLRRTGDLSDTTYVDLQTSALTALSGRDYQALKRLVGFAPGIARLSVAIPVLDDGLAEGDETFRVELARSFSSSGGIVKLGMPRSAVISITDND